MVELAPSLDAPAWVYVAMYAGAAAIVAVVFLAALVGLTRRRKWKNSPAQQVVGVMSGGVLKPSAAEQELSGAPPRGVDQADDQQGPSGAFKKRPFRDEPTITKHIQIADLAGDQEALARLYLERACLDVSKGEYAAAGDLLRKSIMLATSHDIKDIHAAARLELAAIAEADGDMTTACEHWQMARTLFHELDAQDDVKQTDTLMLSNGCPTDWVLTDF